MEGSPVYRHFEFLHQLGLMNVRERQNVVRQLNLAQMQAVTEVIRAIISSPVLLVHNDYRFFRRHMRVLRQLVNSNISFHRKKVTLLRFHSILPRLMRDFYLMQILIIVEDS